MSRIIRLLSGVAFSAVLLACSQPQPTVQATADGGDPVARAEIEAINQASSAAVARGDAAAIVQHYADEAIMLPAGGDFAFGRQAIRRQFEAALAAGLAELRFEIMSVESSGDLAVETGRYEALSQAGHHLDHGKYLVVWRKSGKTWHAIRDIATTSVPPALGSTLPDFGSDGAAEAPETTPREL